METAASDAHGAGRGEDQAAGEGSAPRTLFSAEAGERTVDSPRQQPTRSAGPRIRGKVPTSHARSDGVVDESAGDMESAMEEARHEEAYELFQREMGDSLQRSEMAKEHLGMPLYDERALMSTMSSNSEQDCTGEVLSRTQKPCTMDDHGVIESSARFCYDDRIESPKYRAKGGWVDDGIDEVGSDEEQSEFKLTRFDMDSEEKYQATRIDVMRAEELVTKYLDAGREQRRNESSRRDANTVKYSRQQETSSNEAAPSATCLPDVNVSNGQRDVQHSAKRAFVPFDNYNMATAERKSLKRRSSMGDMLHSLQENLHENINRLAHLGVDRDTKMRPSISLDGESEYVARLPPRVNGGLLTNPLCRMKNQEDFVEEDIQEQFKAQERHGKIAPYGLQAPHSDRVHPFEQEPETRDQAKVASFCSWQETVKRAEVYRSALVANRGTPPEQASLFTKLHDEERMEHLYFLLPYLKTASFMLLALVDLSIALALHLAGDKFDFLCQVEASSSNDHALLEEHYHVDNELGGSPARKDVVIDLWMLIVAHLIVFVCNILKTHESGKFIGLRYFYSTQMYDLEEILMHYLHTMCLILSMALLIKHNQNCTSWAKTNEQPEKHLSVVKMHAHVHVTRAIFTLIQCFGMRAYLRKQLQTVVSTNKRRFVSPEMTIDLDLTYICDRIIGMAMPTVKNAVHRNDIRDVAKFFATRHYGSFVIYNLCEHHEEEGNGNYDTGILFDQVQKLPFHDHNPPSLKQLVRFCQNASHFLNKSPKHTVAVHCRGGKGRTGLFISSLMLWTKLKPTAASALDEFAQRRTAHLKAGHTVQGVTAPGQIRYIHYLEAYMYHEIAIFSDRWALLRRIGIVGMKEEVIRNKAFTFIIECNQEIQYDHGKLHGLSSSTDLMDNRGFEISLVALRGDVRVRFFLFDSTDVLPFESQKVNGISLPSRRRGELGPGATTLKYGGVEGRMCFFICFHTAFVEDGTTSFSKCQIDKIHDSPESKYASDFHIDLDMIAVDTAQKTEFSYEPFNVFDEWTNRTHSWTPFDEWTNRTHSWTPTDLPDDRASTGKDTSAHNAFGLQDTSARNLFSLPFVPPKILPSLWHVNMIAAVHEIFERLSPQITIHSRSDILFSENNEHRRTVMIIARGEVLESPLMQIEGEINAEDQDHSFHNGVRGTHAVVGMIEFMLGQTNIQGTTKVFSQTALLRRISIPTSDSSFVPLIIPGTSPSESGLIFRYFAQQMLSRLRSIRVTLAQTSANSQTLRDIKSGSSILRETQITATITQRFGFSITERLVFSGSAQLSTDDGILSAHGKFCLFNNWIVFLSRHGFARKSRDVLISIRNISSAKRQCSTITIAMVRNDDTPYPLHAVGRESSGAPSLSNLSASARSSIQRILGMGRKASRFSLRPSVAMSAEQSTLAGGLWSTESCTFVFPDAELAERILSMLTKHMQMSNEFKSMSTEWMQTNLQYEKSKFGYVLPDEVEGDERFLQKLSAVSFLRSFEPGEVMLAADTDERLLFHVMKGCVLVYSSTGTPLLDVVAGEIAGESRFLQPNPCGSVAKIVARDRVKCLVTPFEAVEALCSIDPMFSVRFHRGLAIAIAGRLLHFQKRLQMYLEGTNDSGHALKVVAALSQHSPSSPSRISTKIISRLQSNLGSSTGPKSANALSARGFDLLFTRTPSAGSRSSAEMLKPSPRRKESFGLVRFTRTPSAGSRSSNGSFRKPCVTRTQSF